MGLPLHAPSPRLQVCQYLLSGGSCELSILSFILPGLLSHVLQTRSDTQTWGCAVHNASSDNSLLLKVKDFNDSLDCISSNNMSEPIKLIEGWLHHKGSQVRFCHLRKAKHVLLFTLCETVDRGTKLFDNFFKLHFLKY